MVADDAFEDCEACKTLLLTEHIQAIVDSAPPLTQLQRRAIAAILHGHPAETRVSADADETVMED